MLKLNKPKSSPRFLPAKKKAQMKTIKPLKKHAAGTKRYELHKLAKKTLGSGAMNVEALKQAVKLPQGEDVNEWLAVHVYDFFNILSILFAGVMDKCTDKTCPTMSAGKNYVYLWADGDKVKKPIECTASQYIDHLMTWVQSLLDNEEVFPARVEQQFPKNYQSVVCDVFRKLFRIYAHVFTMHSAQLGALDQTQWWNHHFRHFYYFIIEFNLVEKKDMLCLEALITELCP